MAAWLRHLAPDYPEDAERAALARMFNVVALAALVALGVAAINNLLAGQTDVPLAIIVAMAAVVAALMAAARLGHLRLASALLPPLLLATVTGVMLLRDGLHDAALTAIAAALVMGAVSLKRSAFAAFTAAALIVILAVGYAEIAGALQNRMRGFTDWRHVAGVSLSYLFIAVVVRVLMEGMIVSLREAQDKSSALAASYVRLEGETAALKQSEARFAKAVETMAEGMILAGMDGKVRICNRAAERILGLPAAEIIRSGLPIEGLRAVRADGSPFPPEERPATVTLRTGRSRTGVVVGIVRAGGSIAWISVNSSALFGDDGATPNAVLMTFFDISGLKRAEQALRDHAEQLRQLSRRLFEVEESERRRLARELHDRIGPNLTALSLNLSLVRRELPADFLQKASARLDDSEALLASTTQLVRDVLTDLRPPGLDELGLLAALREHAEQVAQRSGFKIDVSGAEPRPRLPPASEIALFRIAQEALTNIVKHAHATAVTVSLRAVPDRVTLTVADDGSGFDRGRGPIAGGKRGMGITSMRERAEAIGARPRFESAPGRGTRVVVEVPYASAPQPAPAQERV